MRFEAHGLEVARGDHVVLAGFEVVCDGGEVAGVFGAGGSGKSSALLALAGMIPAQGVVRLDGAELAGCPVADRARRGLVFCPERRRVFEASSALDNLRMGAHRASSEQLASSLEFVFSLFPALAASSLRRRAAGRLTAGEQQMLSIGRAVMARPRVLLLDEPLQSIQPMLVPSVVDAVRRIAAQREVAVVVADRDREGWGDVVQRVYELGTSGAAH